MLLWCYCLTVDVLLQGILVLMVTMKNFNLIVSTELTSQNIGQGFRQKKENTLNLAKVHAMKRLL